MVLFTFCLLVDSFCFLGLLASPLSLNLPFHALFTCCSRDCPTFLMPGAVLNLFFYEKAKHAPYELVAVQMLRRGNADDVNEVQTSVKDRCLWRRLLRRLISRCQGHMRDSNSRLLHPKIIISTRLDYVISRLIPNITGLVLFLHNHVIL